MVVSSEANMHVCLLASLCDHYSELFTWMAVQKFENAVTQLP